MGSSHLHFITIKHIDNLLTVIIQVDSPNSSDFHLTWFSGEEKDTNIPMSLYSQKMLIQMQESCAKIRTIKQDKKNPSKIEYFVEFLIKMWASGSNNPLWYMLSKMFKGKKFLFLTNSYSNCTWDVMVEEI